jgi:hypothetical protein
MAKYQVGTQYTVWVEVDAEDEDEAIEKANEIDYNLTCNNLGTVEINEYDDPIVYLEENAEDGDE